MSIYATLWKLKFPRDGDTFFGCEWIEVTAQGVPAHIGSPSEEYGQGDDPYSDFLPPPLEVDEHGEHPYMRAVVFKTEGTKKGTARSHQEYVDPLFTISGEEYANATFDALHDRICDALRGDRPRVVAQAFESGGRPRLLYDNGSSGYVDE
jgi:hypothetical protein